jgi:hypothetical protein
MTRVARAPTDRGAALVVTLLVILLVTILGAGLLLAGDVERLIATNEERSFVVLSAADAMAQRMMSELSAKPDWNGILAGAVGSSFALGGHTPRLPSGTAIDLDAITLDIQADSDSLSPGPPNRPQWRLFSWGPLASFGSSLTGGGGAFVAAWIADDRFETDGSPLADSNDVLLLHVEAFGWANARRVVAARIADLPASVDAGVDAPDRVARGAVTNL